MARRRRRRASAAWVPPHPVVAVEWLDASYQDGPLTLDWFETRVHVTTAGWLVARDDKTVSVAQDTRRRGDNGEYRAVVHIPLVNVVRIRRFRHK